MSRKRQCEENDMQPKRQMCEFIPIITPIANRIIDLCYKFANPNEDCIHDDFYDMVQLSNDGYTLISWNDFMYVFNSHQFDECRALLNSNNICLTVQSPIIGSNPTLGMIADLETHDNVNYNMVIQFTPLYNDDMQHQ